MIKITGLNKTFRSKSGDVDAVNGVNLTVNDGEIFGVIGYSGAGKSTLVRCINLLEVPDFGKIEVNGETLFEHFPDSGEKKPKMLTGKALSAARRGIGMIFQHFNLLDRSTVFDNVAYPLKYCGISNEDIGKRVAELLALVGLSDKTNAYPSELSGGQKQRVAIARALANRPSVLLSDEATSALDPDATEQILSLLKELNKTLGLTIVLITHEMSIIKAVTDRVAVMEDGKVVEEGDTYNVFSKPQAAITKKFVASASALSKLDGLISNDGALARARESGHLIKLTFDKESVGDAVISELSRKFSVNVSIILANVDILQAGTLGNLVSVIDGSDENIDAALAYLRECNVGVEVI